MKENKKREMFGYMAILITLAVLFLGYLFLVELYHTYRAHDSFYGYCQWRGETPVYSSNNSGVCITSDGVKHNIMMVRGRWYLEGDGPTKIDDFEQGCMRAVGLGENESGA